MNKKHTFNFQYFINKGLFKPLGNILAYKIGAEPQEFWKIILCKNIKSKDFEKILNNIPWNNLVKENIESLFQQPKTGILKKTSPDLNKKLKKFAAKVKNQFLDIEIDNFWEKKQKKQPGILLKKIILKILIMAIPMAMVILAFFINNKLQVAEKLLQEVQELKQSNFIKKYKKQLCTQKNKKIDEIKAIQKFLQEVKIDKFWSKLDEKQKLQLSKKIYPFLNKKLDPFKTKQFEKARQLTNKNKRGQNNEVREKQTGIHKIYRQLISQVYYMGDYKEAIEISKKNKLGYEKDIKNILEIANLSKKDHTKAKKKLDKFFDNFSKKHPKEAFYYRLINGISKKLE